MSTNHAGKTRAQYQRKDLVDRVRRKTKARAVRTCTHCGFAGYSAPMLVEGRWLHDGGDPCLAAAEWDAYQAWLARSRGSEAVPA